MDVISFFSFIYLSAINYIDLYNRVVKPGSRSTIYLLKFPSEMARV